MTSPATSTARGSRCIPIRQPQRRGNDVAAELALGIGSITAVHLKDTVAVGPGSAGQFRDVPFGEGCVDFAHAFSVLNALGYRGPYLLEMWAREDGQDKQRIAGPRPGSNNR